MDGRSPDYEEVLVSTPSRLSDLSPARQALVRLCQDVNFGQILDLLVANAEPIWDPGPTILSEVRLDIEETPRPEGERVCLFCDDGQVLTG